MHADSRALSSRTTLRLGGPADEVVIATVTPEIPQMVRGAERVFVLAGGSNVVVSDAGFPGTVLLLRNRGIALHRDGGSVTVTVAAGEPWGLNLGCGKCCVQRHGTLGIPNRHQKND